MMISDFGEGWVSSPIEQWTAILLKSGILFWIGGLATAAFHYHRTLEDIRHWLFYSSSFKPVQTLIFIFSIILFVAICASLLKRFDLFTLRFLEGYHLPRWLRQRCINDLNLWLSEEENRFQNLAKNPSLDVIEKEELIRLDWELMYMPDKEERLPTQLGNLLRGFELRSRDKYGLDAFICWHRLWLVMPDSAKKEIAKARYDLDTSVRIFNWGMLFMIWTIWAWWAVPVSLITMFLAYRWILQKAKIYGQLVESAFDLYRHLLYKELRFPLPANPSEEIGQGKRLTEYLWRGSDQSEPRFTD